MPEYRSKATWNEWLDCDIEAKPITVIEVDDGVPTGVLDKHGKELFRYCKVKMGFVTRG